MQDELELTIAVWERRARDTDTCIQLLRAQRSAGRDVREALRAAEERSMLEWAEVVRLRDSLRDPAHVA